MGGKGAVECEGFIFAKGNGEGRWCGEVWDDAGQEGGAG